MKFGINQAISQTITQLSCIQVETPSSRLWNFLWIKTYTTFNITVHVLSIERAGWPKLHDLFKARDATNRQRQLPVSARAFYYFYSSAPIHDVVACIKKTGVGLKQNMSCHRLNLFSLRWKNWPDPILQAPWKIPGMEPERDWPKDGSISFHDYSTRYRAGLDLVLKELTFSIKPGEMVSVQYI